jgi:hypothetical protein
MLFDVQSNGDEVVDDEGGDAEIGINLGFQPSASASHRCGGEIEKQRISRFLRFR